MKFLSVIFLGALALVGHVQAQSTSSSVVSAPVPTTTVESELTRCLNNCGPTDTNCQAHCVSVPSPNQQQVNATTACVAACPQGKGTAADIEAYTTCRNNCIADNFLTTGGTPAPTDTSGDHTSNPSGTSVIPTGSGTSDSPSGTSGGAGATNSPGAAPVLMLSSSVGLLGLFAAMLAL